MRVPAAPLALIACALAACSSSLAPPDPTGDGGAAAPVCMRSDPSCASPAPSYETDIRPIVTAACVTCHYPYSNLAQSSLTSYADIQLVSGSVLGQVSACLMPPPGQPQLSDADRQTLLDWLACGAPDN